MKLKKVLLVCLIPAFVISGCGKTTKDETENITKQEITAEESAQDDGGGGLQADCVQLLRHGVRHEQSLPAEGGYAHRRGHQSLRPHQIYHRRDSQGRVRLRSRVDGGAAAVFQSHRRP